MHIELTPVQARVIGCLIEKEFTTPDQYPLSLNALTNACNQKSNREPVLELNERTVQDTVDELIKAYMVSEQTGYGSRVAKYKHRFCNSDYGKLHFTAPELAIVCELLLRGPQTPGELRSRASRMAPLRDVQEVEALLEALAAREDGPFAVRLPRQPGKREARYAHLFSGEVAGDTDEAPAAHAPQRPESQLEERITQLEAEVATLRERLTRLEAPSPESQLP